MTEPVCPYCSKPAELKDGHYLYGGRLPHLAHKLAWVCIPCDAWVGCHDGTKTPLGTLANSELRRARSAAHAVFDPLWQAKITRDGCSKAVARKAGYVWLAEKLGIPVDHCHIGMMDVTSCRRVVEICKAIKVHA